MNGYTPDSPDDTLSCPRREEESGEYPVLQEPDQAQKERIVLRDKLLRRALEEELLSVAAQPGGKELLDLLCCEPNPHRFVSRLDRYFRLHVVEQRFKVMEKNLEIKNSRPVPINEHSLSDELGQLRFDWLRGKVQRRAEDRRRRERANTLNEEDVLWKNAIRQPKK